MPDNEGEHDAGLAPAVQNDAEAINSPAVPSLAGPLRTQPSLATRVFLGPYGIRAGWRLFVFLFLTVAFGAALFSLVSLLRFRGARGVTPPVLIMAEGIPLLAALLSAAVMAKVERRRLADYGLPARSAFRAKFWQGVVLGFGALSALLLLIRADRGFYFGTFALAGRSIIVYGLLWAIAFLVVGFCEEFLFRGYPLFTLSTGMGFWASAALLSVLFGAIHYHNSGESLAGCAAAVLIGLFFCFTVRRTGTLWFAIGFHASWDYAESFLYSVPDSGAVVPGHLLSSSFHGPAWLTGGSVGPEGSALVFVIIAALFILFNRLYPPARQRIAAAPEALESQATDR